jgi:hypothetical protein
MAIHDPGREGRVTDTPVSTVDLTTTLAPFIGTHASGATCHGIDLLSTSNQRRSLPILFSAMIDGRLTRLGILGDADRKLVVDLRDADARLLRIQDESSVEQDVSFEESDELALRLGQLVRSPLYARHDW